MRRGRTEAGEEECGRPRPPPVACPDPGLLIRTLAVALSPAHFSHDDDDDDEDDATRDTDAGLGGLAVSGVYGQVVTVGGLVPSAACPLRPGHVVVVYPWPGCGSCEACTQRDTHLCESSTRPPTTTTPGEGLASHVAVPEWELAVRLPDHIPPRVGCTLPGPALTAYQALLHCRPALEQAVRVRGYSNLLVVGGGGQGALWLLVLIKAVFCDKNVNVICADVTREALDAALQHGADDVIVWGRGERAEQLSAAATMSGFNKMDAAVDLRCSARTFQAAVLSLHPGGRLVCARTAGGGGRATLHLPTLTARALSVHGVGPGSCQQLQQLVELLAVQQVDRYPPTELHDVNDVINGTRHDVTSAACPVVTFNQSDDDEK